LLSRGQGPVPEQAGWNHLRDHPSPADRPDLLALDTGKRFRRHLLKTAQGRGGGAGWLI
jgi:hypothetical protein